MLRKIICLVGISGSGKTYERTHNPELADLPYVDISDVYKDLNTSDYQLAWIGFVLGIKKLLQTHNVVVAEAAFTWRQQTKIESDFEDWDVKFEYRQMPRISKEILLERVRQDLEASPRTAQDYNYYNARVSMIENLA